jgi:Putative DNA-binding domain
MPDLQSLQRDMAAAILTGDMAKIAGQFEAGTAKPEGRLNIFRNNTFHSLTSCLKAVFPVTTRLADERFFDYAAHEFIARHPPGEARLSHYGSDFPRFLARFAPCKGYPIIPEMASLEWAIAKAQHDEEDLPASLSLLGDYGSGDSGVGLRLQPNLHFAISHWPLIDVWLDHKKHAPNLSAMLQRRTSLMAIHRHGEDIHFVDLDSARFAFWRALARGLTIATAAQRALARDPLFDLVKETVILFRAGLVTGVFNPHQHRS